MVAAANDCSVMNPDCDGHGVCMSNGNCRCFYGFSARNQIGTDCSLNSLDEPNTAAMMNACVIVGCVLYSIIFPFVVWRLIIELKMSPSSAEKSVISKVTKLSLACLTIVSIMCLLTCFDFFAVYHRMPVKLYFVLYYGRDWILPVCFSATLSHWVELYQYTLKSLRQQEMIKKINVNFSATLSVEDVLDRITFLQRFRIPFAICCVITVCLWISFTAAYFHSRDPTGLSRFAMGYSAFHAALWTCFAFAFLFYGLKLLRILPASIGPKIRKMTFQLCFIVIICLLDKVASLVYFSFYRASNVANYQTGIRRLINVIMIWLVVVALLELYMPVHQYKKWLRLSALWDSSRSAGASNSNSGTNNSMSMEVMKEPAPLHGGV
ncbi:hypothetical protein PROFUN_11505 [Planoprotostelium fungivorum]|uniref:EGF-like domain-containing protein n=1 Tax=Planoprotostelium fungivorum TaxID=1890364 RepID=A0A2P6N9Z0_9EUKA|nr:hypothetical protein PROFUN_11505 [Planoprotostelium fungivorum]